jgi:hypothetical protein
MRVITIHEENHGFIGVATTPKAAMQFLVNRGWLDLGTEFYDEETETWYELRHIFESMGVEPTNENIIDWGVSKFDDWHLWDGLFYFGETELHGEV